MAIEHMMRCSGLLHVNLRPGVGTVPCLWLDNQKVAEHGRSHFSDMSSLAKAPVDDEAAAFRFMLVFSLCKDFL